MAVRLLLTEGVEEQWRDVAAPWFHAHEAWKDSRPTVVLTPSRAQGFYLRSRLVEKGQGALGVRFWTPSDARKFLLSEWNSDVHSIPQSDLRLLTRLCAERLLKDEKVIDRASLGSVVQDPGSFLRAFDLVLGAGWDPARDGADYGRMLAAEMAREMESAKIASQAGIHRLLREAPRAKPPLSRVLILGFNATHWPLWDLLQSVCHATDDAAVAFDPPSEFAAAVDQLWIGSWEEFAGRGYEIPESATLDDEHSGLEILASSYEEGTHVDARPSDIHFIATADSATQTRAIVLQALDYLRRPECDRLGIVFPEANALALGVTEQLRDLGLPVDDGPGAFQNGLFETRPWQTWVELQEEPTVRRLIHWLRACETEQVPSGLTTLSASRAAALLDQALGQSLIDDLGFLGLQMEKEKGTDNQVMADFLRHRVALPPEASLGKFLTDTRAALQRLGWKSHLEQIPEQPPSWFAADRPISRATFLAWLGEVIESRERVRPAGNHFYGKIHLLVYGQIAGQTWSHLILTGLNEGVWPRFYEAGAFGSRYELKELNQKARLLNREGTIEGSQGEGHEAVAPGRGHCLLPTERYDLSLRDLCAGLRSTRHAVCLAAMTLGGGRNLLPSDFFNHAWHVKTGDVLEDATFRDLAEAATKRCEQHAALFPTRTIDAQDITATRTAYTARRDPKLPFGPYEFSFAMPPAAPIQLPCKKWQDALDHPAQVWLSEVIGVGAWPEGDLKWPLAMGTWVHRWLAEALREGASPHFVKALRGAADRELAAVEKRVRTAGIELYPWWKHVWGQARSITLGLGAALSPELKDKKILSEISLPSDIFIALPGCSVADFRLQGKIDLLLVEPDSTAIDAKRPDLSNCTCWIVDFKTGAAKKLSAKLVGEGAGLQITLYGLAARALGSIATTMSLHTFDAPLVRQATLNDLLSQTATFRSLDTIHRRGIFGQSPAGESDFRFQPDFPITTRPIPAQTLTAKWALVHEVPVEDESS